MQDGATDRATPNTATYHRLPDPEERTARVTTSPTDATQDTASWVTLERRANTRDGHTPRPAEVC